MHAYYTFTIMNVIFAIGVLYKKNANIWISYIPIVSPTIHVCTGVIRKRKQKGI